MEVTSLCIRLMMAVLVVHTEHGYLAQKVDAAFPRVLPDRLQFFEYETISVNCEEFAGLTEWRVMKKLHKTSPTNSYGYNSSAPSCTIHPTFNRHSGKYWCEDAAGNTSSAVNITVTAGSVILEVPARPVLEGIELTLHCRNKKTGLNHIADFYKDGSHLWTGYENTIIQNVSKSDEGLYKCSISGAGESPESRLTVLKPTQAADEPIPAADEETRPPHGGSPHLSLLLVVISVLMVALPLLLMALLLCRRHRELKESGTGTKPRLPEDSVLYSTVRYRSSESKNEITKGGTH